VEEVEPTLVISRRVLADLQPGQEVVIAAVPNDGFELSSSEEELDVELPEEPYEELMCEPYLRGDAVDTSSSAREGRSARQLAPGCAASRSGEPGYRGLHCFPASVTSSSSMA
jgi:hypothetical protein